MDIAAALEVFMKGISSNRSRLHPYFAERINGLWLLRDGPGRKKPRVPEFFSLDLDPDDTVRRIQGIQPMWHFLCVVHPVTADYDGIRRDYKGLGYRAKSTEGLFIRTLENVPKYSSIPPARRVETDSKPAIRRWVHLFPPESRSYAIWEDEEDSAYGSVRSTPVGDASYVSDLFVVEKYRNRGFGRALMSTMLQDDMAHGIRTSVLFASSAGARLYPHLGYEKIGIIQLFCPLERT